MRHTIEGVTLVEVCAVIAISALITAMSAPSLRSVIVRQALRGSADELRTDLQFLRASGIARGEVLWFAIQQAPGGTCYVIHTGNKGDCTCSAGGEVRCNGSTAMPLKAAALHDDTVHLASNVDAMAFDPGMGTVTPTGTLTLHSERGEEIRQVVGITGRVRSCSPAGKVPGYAAC